MNAKRLRILAGLTQTKAAKTIGITLRCWQQWELGERKQNENMLELFALKAGIATLGTVIARKIGQSANEYNFHLIGYESNELELLCIPVHVDSNLSVYKIEALDGYHVSTKDIEAYTLLTLDEILGQLK